MFDPNAMPFIEQQRESVPIAAEAIADAPEPTELPEPAGDTILTPRALNAAIRLTFSRESDPTLLGYFQQPTRSGPKVTLHFLGVGQTANDRKSWIRSAFHKRWESLERQLGLRVHLRRRWWGGGQGLVDGLNSGVDYTALLEARESREPIAPAGRTGQVQL